MIGNALFRFSKCRILVVDQHHDSAQVAGLTLMLRGHIVRTAHEHDEAFVAAIEFRPQAAVIAVGPEDYGGLNLARRLIKLFGCADFRLVAVSTSSRAGVEAAARTVGVVFHCVLQKPVDPDELAAAMERGGPTN